MCSGFCSCFFFFSSRRRHTRFDCDWSSDVCSSDLRFTDEMSSGEARRMLIARALVHDPRALVLDEPSVALDLSAQHELRLIFRKLAQSGIGIVMVTHHLSDLIPEIQRVLLMNRGRIIADGPTKEVLVESKLSELFGRPLQLSERDGYYNLW